MLLDLSSGDPIIGYIKWISAFLIVLAPWLIVRTDNNLVRKSTWVPKRQASHSWVLEGYCRLKSYIPNNVRTQYGRSGVPFMHQDSRPWQ